MRDFNWEAGSPGPAIGDDSFSARWTGFVETEHAETYTFDIFSEDGVRLWIGDERIIEDWTIHRTAENNGTIELEAGKRYPIKLEFFEHETLGNFHLLQTRKSL